MASDGEESFEDQLRNINMRRSRERSRSGSENLQRGDELFGVTSSRGDAFETPLQPTRFTFRTPPAAPTRSTATSCAERLLSGSLGRAERVLTMTDTPREVSPVTSTPLERYRRTASATRLGTEFTESPIPAATTEIATQTARFKAEREERERRTQLLIEQQREEAALERAKQAEREALEQLQQQRAAAGEAENALLEKEVERLEREAAIKTKREELLRRRAALTGILTSQPPSLLPSRVPSPTPSVQSIATARSARINTSVLQTVPIGHGKIPTTSAIEETYRTAAPAPAIMSEELFNKAMKHLDSAITSSTGHVFKGSNDTQTYTD